MAKMAKSKGEIVISEQFCKGCGYCVEFCPKDCVITGDKFSTQGYQLPIFVNEECCTACAICGKMCPESAIEVYKYVS